jgi:hypothetical protein
MMTAVEHDSHDRLVLALVVVPMVVVAVVEFELPLSSSSWSQHVESTALAT